MAVEKTRKRLFDATIRMFMDPFTSWVQATSRLCACCDAGDSPVKHADSSNVWLKQGLDQRNTANPIPAWINIGPVLRHRAVKPLESSPL